MSFTNIYCQCCRLKSLNQFHPQSLPQPFRIPENKKRNESAEKTRSRQISSYPKVLISLLESVLKVLISLLVKPDIKSTKRSIFLCWLVLTATVHRADLCYLQGRNSLTNVYMNWPKSRKFEKAKERVWHFVFLTGRCRRHHHLSLLSCSSHHHRQNNFFSLSHYHCNHHRLFSFFWSTADNINLILLNTHKFMKNSCFSILENLLYGLQTLSSYHNF